MSEDQLKSQCEFCGFPIDIGEHASDCPNSKEQDKEKEVEVKNENELEGDNKDQSEIDIFSEQLEKEEQQIYQVIESLKKLQELNISEQAESTLDDIDFDNFPSHEDVRAYISGMRGEAEKLLQEVEKTQKEIGDSVRQFSWGKDSEEKGLDDWEFMIAQVIEKAQEINDKVGKISNHEIDSKNIWQQYQTAALEKFGYSNFEDIDSDLDDLYDEDYEHSSKILGEFRNKGKLKKIRDKKKQLQELAGLNRNYDLDYIKQTKDHLKYPLTNLSSDRESLASVFASFVIEKYKSLVGNERKNEWEIRDGKVEKSEILDSEVTDSLNNDFANKLLDKWLAEDNLYDVEIEGEMREKVIDIIKRSIDLKFNINIRDEEYLRNEQQINENNKAIEINELIGGLPEDVRKTLKYKIRDKQGRMGHDFEEIANFFTEQHPIYEKKKVASEVYARILRQLDTLDTGDEAITNQTYYQKQGMRNDRSNGDLFTKFIYSLDMKMWDSFCNNEKIKEKFGQEKLEKMNQQLLKGIMSKIINLPAGSDSRVNLAYKMKEFKTPESVQLFVINSFMEPGYQNQYPFLNRSGLSNESEVFQYVDSLTQDQIDELSNLGMNEVVEIIRLMKDNPENFNEKKLYVGDNESAEKGDNPVYSEIRAKIMEASIKFLKEMPEMQSYVLNMLKEIKTEFKPEVYEGIEDMIKNPFDENIEQQLPLFMLAKIDQGDTKITKMWIENPLKLKDSTNSLLVMASKDEKIPGLLQTLDKLDEKEGEGNKYRRKYTDEYFKDAMRKITPEGEEIDITPEELQKFDENLKYLSEQGEEDAFNFMVLEYIAKHPDHIERIGALAKNKILSVSDYNTKWGFLRNLENLIADDKSYESTLKYLDAAITPPESEWDDENYNYGMLGEDAFKFIALHSDKVDSILELKELGLFDRGIGSWAYNIFKYGESLLLDDSNFDKLKGYVTSVISKSENDQRFYLDFRVISHIGEHPENMNDILNLGEISSFEDNSYRVFMIENIEKIIAIPAEKRVAYVEVFTKIDKSPSQEIQKLKDQLLEQLLDTENPIKAYEVIESIFIKNNLPTVGKVYKVFSELYPAEKIEEMLSNARLSPTLKNASGRRRQHIIYKDLLKTHIESGNLSLKEYLTVIQSGEGIMNSIDEKGINNLDPKEIEQAEYFLGKLNTLFDSSQLGKTTDKKDVPVEADIAEQYRLIQESLGVREGQSISDRISEMFLKPLGYDSIDAVLEKMKEVKQNAHDRSLEMVEKSVDGKLNIQAGDLLKGVDYKYFANIMQNGSVAREYLGASADSDMTPFDTDLSKVLDTDFENGNESAVDNSIASGFGELIFVVKDRGQYQDTTDLSKSEIDTSKLELFNSGTERHNGIRTGFASTEIDFMLVHNRLENSEYEKNKIFFEIAKNGHYIPVTDKAGNIIFTPEQYREMRETFEGVDKYNGPDLDIIPAEKDSHHNKSVSELSKTLKLDREKVKELSDSIKNEINTVLSNVNIQLKSEFDTGLVGAEIYDTGSTGRYTNTPGSYDYDFTLKLDDDEFSKVPGIINELKTRFKPERIEEYGSEHHQLRAYGCTGLSDTPIDIDVGIVRKSELAVFGSHDAVGAKLNWIKDNIGEEAYEDTVANIVLTKQVLKEGNAYKKIEHGGIGGIGVENWVLLHGGNMVEAFKSFKEAAYEGDKKISLTEFKQKYKVLDAGVNIQKLSHDNYIDKLTEQGYQAMLDSIEKYLTIDNEENRE